MKLQIEISCLLFLSIAQLSLGFTLLRLRPSSISSKAKAKQRFSHTSITDPNTNTCTSMTTSTHSTTSTSLHSTSKKKRSTTRSWTSSATTITGKWRHNYELLKTFSEQHGHARVPYNYAPNPELGRWVHRQRMIHDQMEKKNQSSLSSSSLSSSSNTKTKSTSIRKTRPATVLTKERIEALEKIGFTFESPRKRTWNKRFDELCQYKAVFGDCLVPLHYGDIPGLGVWVRNQRTQYRNFLMGRKQSNTLNPERIAALQSIGFVWDTQRNDQWKKRFDELVDFKAIFGHCSVPEKYHENPQLGAWVVNQRTSYKNFFAGNTGFMSSDNESTSQLMGSSAKKLTREKIAALESIGFCWDQTTYNWYSMYERLKQYRKEKMQQYDSKRQDSGALSSPTSLSSKEEDNDLPRGDFFHVPPEDVANRDLRLWVAVQRKEYSNYMQNKNISGSAMKRSSMTPRRKRALDVINFPWSVNKQKYAEGPTVDDWTKLFEQMREKGIDKNVRPKEHWFEGQNPFGVPEELSADKEQWNDDDLLELWNMEDDE